MKGKTIGIGAAVACVGFATLLELSKVTPYQFFNCSSYEGGTQCFGSMNPIYPIIFAISIGGLVLLFWGLFGRRFILNPLFIIGMILDAYGLLAIIFGYIGFESCGSGPIPSLCMAYHPEFAEPFVLVGSVLIAAAAISTKTFGMPTLSKLGLAGVSGIVLITTGTVLIAFGWIVVGTFVGNYVTLHWDYLMQLAFGSAFVLLGVMLVGLSGIRRKSGVTKVPANSGDATGVVNPSSTQRSKV